MPFRTDVYDVTQPEVVGTLGKKPRTSELESERRIGMKDLDDWEGAEKCHTQGIVHTGDFIITSCMTIQPFHDEESQGFVQFFEYRGMHNFEEDYKDGAQGGEVRNRKLLTHPHPHAVPGQMVRGIQIMSDTGVLVTHFRDVCLFPVGSERSSGGDQDPENPNFNLHVFDQFGNTFPNMEAVLPGGYACGAFFSYLLPGEAAESLLLLVIDKTSFSLFRFPWDRVSCVFGPPEPLIEEEGRDSVFVNGVENLYSNLLDPQYQAACMFYGSDGLYLVATHKRWIDTYKIQIGLESIS